jgi:predicted GIY-YIG superfamily endonuclease
MLLIILKVIGILEKIDIVDAILGKKNILIIANNLLAMHIDYFKISVKIMFYIYILLLESNKYYIGKTKKPKFRIDKHFKSNTTAWTSKYKPIKLVEIIHLEDSFDEDKYTLRYMKQYGISNVRGGSFSQVRMSKEGDLFEVPLKVVNMIGISNNIIIKKIY